MNVHCSERIFNITHTRVMNKKIFVFLFLAYSCSVALESNICEVDPDVKYEDSCETVNGASKLASLETRQRCRQLIKGDGDSCIQAYYRFRCSQMCRPNQTPEKICTGICDELKSECPEAHGDGCFSEQLKKCSGGDNCDDIDINEDQILTEADDGNIESSSSSSEVSSNSANNIIVNYLIGAFLSLFFI